MDQNRANAFCRAPAVFVRRTCQGPSFYCESPIARGFRMFTKSSFVLVIMASLAFALPAAAQQQGNGQGPGGQGAGRARVCANPALSDADKAACTKAMQSATTREERAKIRETYSAKAAGAPPQHPK